MVGRKGGGSRMAAAIAVYAACFGKYKLSRGERGMVLVLAMSMEQARVVFDYALAFLSASDVLRSEIASTTSNEIRLKNGITIATHANSFRSVRGRTLCCCVFDEVAFWRDDSTAISDTETYTAILPSLLTTNDMLIGISSAYRRLGLLFTKHRDFFGVDDADTLVVAGGTTAFNLSIDDARLAAMRAADPTAAASEWDSEFRDDLSGLFDDTVELIALLIAIAHLNCRRSRTLPTNVLLIRLVAQQAATLTALRSGTRTASASSSTLCVAAPGRSIRSK